MCIAMLSIEREKVIPMANNPHYSCMNRGALMNSTAPHSVRVMLVQRGLYKSRGIGCLVKISEEIIK